MSWRVGVFCLFLGFEGSGGCGGLFFVVVCGAFCISAPQSCYFLPHLLNLVNLHFMSGTKEY